MLEEKRGSERKGRMCEVGPPLHGPLFAPKALNGANILLCEANEERKTS